MIKKAFGFFRIFNEANSILGLISQVYPILAIFLPLAELTGKSGREKLAIVMEILSAYHKELGLEPLFEQQEPLLKGMVNGTVKAYNLLGYFPQIIGVLKRELGLPQEPSIEDDESEF